MQDFPLKSNFLAVMFHNRKTLEIPLENIRKKLLETYYVSLSILFVIAHFFLNVKFSVPVDSNKKHLKRPNQNFVNWHI